jgi:hypothetical protein
MFVSIFSPGTICRVDLLFSIFCTGAAKINVIDISEVNNPRIVYHEVLGDFDPTDVEFCGDHVFVSLDNNQNREMGRLIVFKKYDVKFNSLEAVLNITGKSPHFFMVKKPPFFQSCIIY